MNQKESIKSFVQNSLGCKCPEEVFNSIELKSGILSLDNEPYSEKIVIGSRLLIYISKLNGEASISIYLPKMIEMGIKERDHSGLNRFRAVVATQNPQVLKPIAEKIFKQLNIHDDKVHLHIIDLESIDILRRAQTSLTPTVINNNKIMP